MPNAAKTILIIDDESTLRDMVRIVLEEAGYLVLEAPNGEEGLGTALRHMPDLVLCDIEMPRLSGFEVLQMFRDNPKTALVPFVFLTGRSDRTDIRKGMQLGADDFLTKPFQSDELLTSVSARLLRRDKEQSESEKKLEELRLNISTSVPHELRTPLTGVLGFAKILKEQGASSTPEELAEIADHIIGSAVRLEQTLEKFWSFTEIRFQRLDTRALEALKKEKVLRADSLVKLVAKERAASFQRVGDLQVIIPQQFGIHASDRHMTTLLSEILDNAFRFSRPKTPVTVTCSLNAEVRECSIEIRDKGMGMTRDQIDSIGGFMQFDRKRREQQGLGLGLAISREIARLYSGDLGISSTPQGTAVTVRLPISQNPVNEKTTASK